MLFDSVHILKCIQNNWINLKNYKKTFSFPDFEDNEKILRASFADLETIYLLEIFLTLKKAPALSWKALHSHALKRQNVKLALKVFSNTTAAALNCYGPDNENLENWNGTASFINLVWKWWCVVNVKHPLKGRNTRNIYAHPIDTVNHKNLQFLSSLATWLDCWSNKNKTLNEGFLSKDTYLTFKHTLKVIVEVAKYLIETLKFDFVLLGCFQTENLESSFGQYRQMYGGNRLISVQELTESEKKLKIKSLLKLHSDAITVPVKEYLSEFAECDNTNKISEEDKLLIEELPYENVCFDETQLPVLLYVAGYAAKRITAKIYCLGCKRMLIDENGESLQVDIDKSIILYFEELNRGGLIYPSSTVLQAFQAAHAIFTICILQDYEKTFLKIQYPKKFLLRAIFRYWKQYDVLQSLTNCNLCPQDSSTILL